MYGMVLMLALSNGPVAPAWQDQFDTPAVKQAYGDHGHRAYRHRRGGCHGGGGCYGGGYGGCYGGYGGCYGGGYGMGYGCSGGGMGYGCMGAYSMGYGYTGGGWGCSGMSYGSPYNPMMYQMPGMQGGREMIQPGRQERREERRENKSNKEEARTDPNAATLVVDLPAAAKLTIDGTPTQATSDTRTFVSPPLTPGQEYYYDLKAEMSRDGKTQTATKRVLVRAGEETHVRLDFNTANTAE